MIVFSLKTKVGKNMIFALKNECLILFKDKNYI